MLLHFQEVITVQLVFIHLQCSQFEGIISNVLTVSYVIKQ